MSRTIYRIVLLVLLMSLVIPSVMAQEEVPNAEIVNDEGGPVRVEGEVNYTNPFFTAGVAQPLVILEDQAGFVDRNRGFLMPTESQVLGQITSDFFTPPFTYSISLPIEPAGTLRDVDQDEQAETGVMIFAPAYWTNTYGDPYLEERDLGGGGWSSAYASTRISPDPSAEYEVIGGKYLIYAPDDQQSFPSGFGEDGRLFTEDDPIVNVPQGYTVVDMDTDPFTFDRSEVADIDLIEGEGTAADDFSEMSYTEAFDAMIEKFRTEYAFSEYKGLDWDALSAEFRPRFEEAEANSDPAAYLKALSDFAWSIPDGHVAGPFLAEEFQFATAGGLGMAIRELDDGRVITNFILEEGPAAQAGIEERAEILELNGVPIQEAISSNIPWSSPFGTEHTRRLQQLRYAIRFPVDTEVEVTFQNPGDTEPQTATLTTIAERESFSFSSFNVGLTGFELPLEYRLLEDSGYAYVKIYSFFDNELLTIQLWERLMQTLNENGIPGLIIDMRQNGGGNGFLADQMAAYFFQEPLELGNNGFYDETLGEFYYDPNRVDRFYLPPENLRYDGEVAVLIGPNCNSACEFFSYDMTRQDRAAIVGQYPTGGLGGSVEQFFMPEGETFQFTIGRAVDENGEIHIEGKGVAPTVLVPVNEETLFSEGDPILEYAIEHLNEVTALDTSDAGPIAIGDEVTGELAPRQRVRYTLPVSAGDLISIFAESEAFTGYIRLYFEGSEDVIAEGEGSLEELEIPQDFTLIVEVGSSDDNGEGAYTLRVVDLNSEGSAEAEGEITEATAEAPAGDVPATAEPAATAEPMPASTEEAAATAEPVATEEVTPAATMEATPEGTPEG